MSFATIVFETKAARTNPIADFTNTFLLEPRTGSISVLKEVLDGASGDRRRRVHNKSKDGCLGCKRRRVKCNGKTPCEACTRRNERCERNFRSILERDRSIAEKVIPYVLPRTSTPRSPFYAISNRQNDKILHHFQLHTLASLVLPDIVWRKALQLSTQCPFLLDAMLCLSARHLNFLDPANPSYATVASSHLSRALSGFREAISQDLTSQNLDVFIATSTLLQLEIWSETPPCSSYEVDDVDKQNEDVDTSHDPIFDFCASMKRVFLQGFNENQIQNSIFMPHIADNPMTALVEAARIGRSTLNQFLEHFSTDRPLCSEMLDAPLPYMRDTNFIPTEDWVKAIHFPSTSTRQPFQPIVTWLCLLLSFLPGSNPPNPIAENETFMPKLARYVFSFPIIARGFFAERVKLKGPHALVLLYHFYRAAGILLPSEKYWWAHNRAVEMGKMLKKWLLRQLDEGANIEPRHYY